MKRFVIRYLFYKCVYRVYYVLSIVWVVIRGSFLIGFWGEIIISFI